MARNREPPGPDVRGTVQELLKQSSIPGARASEEDIVLALTNAAAAVADAHAERDHWRAAFGVVQTEMVMLASVLLGGRGREAKLVVKAEQFKLVAKDMQLQVGNPEPGVRVYQLVKVRPQDAGQVLVN